MAVLKLPKPLIRCLTIMDWDNAHQEMLLDMKDIKSLIVWLEELKIRLYSIEERRDLQRIEDKDEIRWFQCFVKYLRALKIPLEENFSLKLWNQDQSVQLSLLTDLIYCALEDEYLDAVENHTIHQVKGGPILDAEMTDSSDETFSELIDPLNLILQQFDLPLLPSHSVTVPMILSAVECIDRYLKSDSTQENQWKDQLHKLPLAYCLDAKPPHPSWRELIATLRLLHQKDISERQSVLNSILAKLQEAVANPKFDTTLRKDGV